MPILSNHYFNHSIDFNMKKTDVRLSDFAENVFSMWVYRRTRSQSGCVLILFHLEIIGDQ